MRKSVLLAGSALAVAGLTTAGAQKAEAAEFSLGAYMPFIVGGADSDNEAENQKGMSATDTEVYVTGSTELENGISVAVKFQFKANEGTSGNVDENEIEVSGSFGMLSLGHEDGPADLMNLGATKTKAWAYGSFANTTGVPVNFTQYSNAATSNEAGLDSSDAIKMAYYTPRFPGFQAGVAWAMTGEITGQTPGSNADHFEFGANYMNSFEGIDVGLAASYWMADASTAGQVDADRWSLGAMLGYEGFTVSGQYSDGERFTGQDVMTWDIGVGYSTGPWGMHLTYEYGEADTLLGQLSGDASMFHGGVSYALGPGVSTGAGIGFGNDDGDSGSDKDYVTFTTGLVVSF